MICQILTSYRSTWSDIVSDYMIWYLIRSLGLMSYYVDVIWYRIRSLDLILYQIVGSDIVSDHIIWYVASNYWIWYQIRSYNLIPCQIILWSDMISDSNIVLEYDLISYQLSDHILLDMIWYCIRSYYLTQCIRSLNLISYQIIWSDVASVHWIWLMSGYDLIPYQINAISDHMIWHQKIM